MRRHWNAAALCLAGVMAVSGCRTPAAMGPQGMSASDTGGGGSDSGGSDSGGSGDSSQGDSSNSDSGGSGDSSQGDSSNSGGSSDSGGSSEGGSSDSGGSSGEGGSSQGGTSDGTSRSSEEGGSSEGSSGTEKAEGEASRSNSRNSSQSNGDVMSAATVGALVVGLGVVIWQAYAAAERRRGAVEPEELGRAAQVYLRARTHQLREDLALGAGPTVEDLAAAARIRREHLGVFGRMLRTHRHELLAMANASTLTPARALAWLERVGELARADPRLDEDRQAFLLTPAGAEAAEVTR